MSNPWRILGIPKGSDRAAIRRGYAKKLKTTNPEDDPEAFKRLREAYEWALQMASYQLAEDEPEDIPAEIATAPHDAPPEQPAPPPEPADPEADELDGLVDALETKLGGPWRNDAHAHNLFTRIIDHPGMDRLDSRTKVEFRIGALIAEHVPGSDAILLDAIKAFEWNRVGRAEQWPFVAALDRYEEWKLIAAFERGGHPFHRAWGALTSPSATRWSRTLLAHSHHGPRIAELIDIIDYQSPGLLPSTLPAEVAWWRARVGQGTFTIASYGWAVLVGLLVWGLLWLAGTPIVLAIVFALASFAIVAADCFGIERGYQRLGIWWNRKRPPSRRIWQWLMRFWPLLMAVVPFLVLLLPTNWWATGLVVTLCATTVVGLRLSGDGQLTPLAMVWGAIALLIVALGLAAGSQLPPPLRRLVMLVAVCLLLVQPLIAARSVLLEMADARLRNYGAFLFLLYAIVLAGTAWVAVDRGLVDSASAAVLVALTLWVLSPMIAASHLLVANIAARIVRGLALLIALLIGGMANPVNVAPDMTGGEAILALHLDMSGDPLPRAAAAMVEMQRRNPDLYRRIKRALPKPPLDSEAVEDSAYAIDRLIDDAVPSLVPVTSAKLAGRYQRAKIDLLYAIRMTDAAKCADGILQVSPDLDPESRRKVSSVLLAIAAHGRADSWANRLADLPRKADYDKAVETLRPTVDATRIQAGVSNDLRYRCTDRIARAQALADMPDDAIAAVLSLPPTVATQKR